MSVAALIFCQEPIVGHVIGTSQEHHQEVSNAKAYIGSALGNSGLPSPELPLRTISPGAYCSQKQIIKSKIESKRILSFEDFDYWMRWDQPSDVALSPSPDVFDFNGEPRSPKLSGPEISIMKADDQANILPGVKFIFSDSQASQGTIFQDRFSLFPAPTTSDIFSSESVSWSWPSAELEFQSCDKSSTYQQELQLSEPTMALQSRCAVSASTSSSPRLDDTREKSKPIIDDDEDRVDARSKTGKRLPIKKTAYNMTEERYQTGLSTHFSRLQDSDQSGRIPVKEISPNARTQEHRHGLAPANRLNEASVLSKAIEYIEHLKEQNSLLSRENATLQSKVDALML